MARISKIELRGVTKSFGGAGAEKTVLSGLDFTFVPGRLYVLRGRSGCGKSTLASLVGLLDDPTSGTILYDGNGLAAGERDPYRRRNVSFLFQDNNFFPEMSGLDNLLLVTRDEARARSVAGSLGLGGLLGKSASELSKGEGERLAIARVILEDKPLMLFDEPTGNLDRANADRVYRILSGLAESRIVIAISHDFEISDELRNVALLRLAGGALTAEGLPDSPSASPQETLAFPAGRLPFAAARSFSRGFFRRNRVKTAAAAVLSAILAFFASASFASSSFDPSAALSSGLDAAGAPALSAVCTRPLEGAFRLWDEGVLDSSGATFASQIAYSCGAPFGDYGRDREPDQGEVLVPAFKAERFGIGEGDALTVCGETLSARIVSYDYAGRMSSLTSRIGEGPASDAIERGAPMVVSSAIASAHSRTVAIPLAKESLLPLMNYLKKEAESLPGSGLAIASDKAGADGLILPSWMKKEEGDEAALGAFLAGREFKVVPEDGNGDGFDLSRLLKTITVSYVSFSDEARFASAVTLALSKEHSDDLSARTFALGEFSALGEDGYLIPASSFSDPELLGCDVDYCGLFSKADISALRAMDGGRAYFLAGGLVASAFLLVVSYFYAFSFERGFRNERNLLSAIGFRKSGAVAVGLFVLGAACFAPGAIGSLALYPAFSGVLSGQMLSLFQASASFGVCPARWWAALGVFLLSSVSLAFTAAFEGTGRANLLNMMKESKE